jgi:hypothetical protein
MAITKQAFYEGAALHLLARTSQIKSIRYDAPFFHINGRLSVLFKYSTKGRSPWGFTFATDEQILLRRQSAKSITILALVCGADGVAAFSYESYHRIAPRKMTAVHISCYREHGEHYEVNGPDGTLSKKVAPSNWQRIIEVTTT